MKKYDVQFTVRTEEMISDEVPQDDIFSYSLPDVVEAETEEEAKVLALQWFKDHLRYSRFEIIEETESSIMLLALENVRRREYIISSVNEVEEFQK